MPPLRDRKEDIPLLVEHFLVKYRHAPGAIPTTISEEAIQKLVAYDWPGNVRELENAIERAVVLSRGNPITSEHLPFGSGSEKLDQVRPAGAPIAIRGRLGRAQRRRSRMPMATMGWRMAVPSRNASRPWKSSSSRKPSIAPAAIEPRRPMTSGSIGASSTPRSRNTAWASERADGANRDVHRHG